jgi:hypothetical protein
MSQLVVATATLECSKGTTPSALAVPSCDVNGGNQLRATIQDYKPNVNVKPFGMCTSSANPQVAAANNTPQPCQPLTTTPWSPGSSTVRLGNQLALSSDSTCNCQWGGVIRVDAPGQTSIKMG